MTWRSTTFKEVLLGASVLGKGVISPSAQELPSRSNCQKIMKKNWPLSAPTARTRSLKRRCQQVVQSLIASCVGALDNRGRNWKSECIVLYFMCYNWTMWRVAGNDLNKVWLIWLFCCQLYITRSWGLGYCQVCQTVGKMQDAGSKRNQQSPLMLCRRKKKLNWSESIK